VGGGEETERDWNWMHFTFTRGSTSKRPSMQWTMFWSTP